MSAYCCSQKDFNIKNQWSLIGMCMDWIKRIQGYTSEELQFLQLLYFRIWSWWMPLKFVQFGARKEGHLVKIYILIVVAMEVVFRVLHMHFLRWEMPVAC